MSNIDEYLAGTNPRDRDSVLRLSMRWSAGSVVISWGGSGLILQAADSVIGRWTDFSSGTSVDGQSYTVTLQPIGKTKFFRLRVDRVRLTSRTPG